MRTILSLGLLCCLIAAHAQKLNYTWSPMMEWKYKEESIDKVLSYDNNGLFILRKIGDMRADRVVEKYKDNLALDYQTDLKLETKGVRDFTGYLHAVVCNGTPYVFFYHWDDAKSTYNVIVRKINEKGLLGDEITIGKDEAEKFGKAPDYKFISSPDGSKIAAIGLMPFEKESIEKWHVLIYNVDGMSKVLDKTMECLVPRERYEINDMMLTNSGSLQVFKMWDVKKEGKYNAIVTVKPDGNIKRTDISTGGKAISFHKVFVNRSGHSSVIGFLNPDEKDWKRISSHFYVSVDENGEIRNNTIEPLGEMVLSHVFAGIMKGKAEKEEQPLKEYQFADFIETDNGDMELFIEFYSELSKTAPNTDPLKMIYQYERTHKKVLVVRLDKTGKKLWAQELDKKQVYNTLQSNKYWGGFVPLVSDNQTYLLWNNMEFPTVPGKLAIQVPGWYDASRQKHIAYDEYGDRAGYYTCLSGIDDKGEVLFKDQPIPGAMPMIGMYKDAIYSVGFSSRIFARNGNSVVLIMEMPAGATAGGTKYQFCKVTLS